MKNKLIIALSTALCLSISSCMKSKSCTCTKTNGETSIVGTMKTSSSSKMRKYETDCKNSSTYTEDNGVITSGIKCEAK